MAAIPRDQAHLKSTLGLHVELPANPNGSAGNPIVLLQGDSLLTLGNIHPLACIDDKPLPPPGMLTILKSFMDYHYGGPLGSQLCFPVPNKLLSQHSLVNSHVYILEDLRKKSPSFSLMVTEKMMMRMS